MNVHERIEQLRTEFKTTPKYSAEALCKLIESFLIDVEDMEEQYWKSEVVESE